MFICCFFIFVAPSKPQHLTAVFLSPVSVRLTWLKPKIPQQLIQLYTISIHGEPIDGRTTKIDKRNFNISGHGVIDDYTDNLPNLNFTVTLSPFTHYSIEVGAVGSRGHGAIAYLTLRTNETG